MKKIYEITTLYKCKALGARNNGLLKTCDFQFEFKDGFTPHCPQCGSPMRIVPNGRSLSELMRLGYNLHHKPESDKKN